ncbi:MAG: TetR/AcrR family transcriptional regulator [Candidatus Neoclostridium sp.]
MKDAIIAQSIESLKKDGLKFSVDSLAARLGVSKKTIYKYFPDKESLAFAVFEKYFSDAREKAAEIAKNPSGRLNGLIKLLLDSKIMTRDEVFNKYALNLSVSAFAKRKESELWNCVFALLPPCDDAVRVIVEGTLERLSDGLTDCDEVIKRLEVLW